MVQTSLDEVEVTLSSSSNLAPVGTTQTEERSQQRSSRNRKIKPPDGQQGEKKDRKRDTRSKSKSRAAGQKKESRAKFTENQPTTEPPKIEVVPPNGKFEDMQRRKMREPCFRCGQAGHWRRECMNAAVCQNCGQMNTTARNCIRCTSKVHKYEIFSTREQCSCS